MTPKLFDRNPTNCKDAWVISPSGGGKDRAGNPVWPVLGGAAREGPGCWTGWSTHSHWEPSICQALCQAVGTWWSKQACPVQRRWPRKEVIMTLSIIILLIKNEWFGVPVMAQWKRIWLVSMRTRVQSLASLSVLRIPALPWPVVQVTNTAWIPCCCGCGRGQQLQPIQPRLIRKLVWEFHML